MTERTLEGLFITPEGESFLLECDWPSLDIVVIECEDCGPEVSPQFIFHPTIEPTDDNMMSYLLSLLQDVFEDPHDPELAKESRFWDKFDPPAPSDGLERSLETLRERGYVLNAFNTN